MNSLRSINFIRIVNAGKGLAIGLALLPFLACNGGRDLSDADRLRAENCKPAEAEHEFLEAPYHGGKKVILSFQSIRANVNSACSSCHMAPGKTGGFTYIDFWQGSEQTINGVTAWMPGFSDVAEKMRDYIRHADPKKRMPPEDRRASNSESFLAIGDELDAWIKAGKPNGTFELGKVPEERRGKFRPEVPRATSDLGDCIPLAKAVGFDYKADHFFAGTKSLPKYLSDTDLFTIDPLALALHGTLAYNVEYPLWADNANKGRWIHVPRIQKDGELVKQGIDFDSVTGQFRIPENTRFYKTFYRAIKLPNKTIRMRRMETRIIVARTPWEDSLFGTYQWDESEQVATLVEAPYRDGSPWKDIIFDVVADETTLVTRPYAIPGRQRCIDCHMGSPMNNFVLGFLPIQINKRPVGLGGRTERALGSDLDQVERFISYDLLRGIRSAAELPVLESSGNSSPSNEYELRANGYVVGNCYHCHNPKGLAFTKENGIQLALGPGEIFNFDTHRLSREVESRRLVHQQGDLDSSQIWRKIFDSDSQQGFFNRMPMHTAGAPDCRLLTVMGQWIRSFESLAAADEWKPECKKENPFFWIDLDPTWFKSDHYTPLRSPH